MDHIPVGDSEHPTSSASKKTKNPPPTRAVPALLSSIAKQRLVTESDEPREESLAENERKRLGSTWNTPRSDSARVWVPHDYDHVMDVGPAG